MRNAQYLFFILPVFYVSLLFVVLHNLVGYYITMPDPVYLYLMNGTNIASGHFGSYVDHPGTPVQCFAAIVIFLKYLLTGTHSQPLYQDVLLNPESYLYASSMAMIALMGFTTYLTAKYVYNNTGSIMTALFFQLTPLVGGVYNTSTLRPEALIIITATFFTAYLYVNVLAHERSADKKWNHKQVIIMGIFSAFLISCKITCAPFILPVFFLLSERKWKMLYMLTVICGFFIFIIPVLPSLSHMYDWVISLITHDGHYGDGNKQIVNVQEFKKNIQEIFTSSFIFTSLYIIILVAFIGAIIRRKNYSGIYPQLILGIWLAISILVIMVAKHYSFYYLIPALAFLPLGSIISYNMFREHQAVLDKKFFKYIFPAAIASILIYQTIDVANRERKYKNPILETQKFLSSYKRMPIIMGCQYDSPFIEPSLYFGIVYSGDLRHQYNQFANEKYPESYLYNVNQKRLFKWNINVMPGEIFEKNNEVLFYFRNETEQSEKNILDDLFPNMLSDFKNIYINPKSQEALYLLKADTAKLKNMLTHTYRVSSDLEKVTEDKSQFISSDSKITLNGALKLSTEEHFSGNNSIKLDKKNQYGLDMSIEVHSGDFIDVTVWRKADDKTGVIVLQSAIDKNLFYTGGEAIIKTEGTWEQIQCRAKIPDNYPEKIVNCYLYYYGKGEVYFDDVEVKIYSK